MFSYEKLGKVMRDKGISTQMIADMLEVDIEVLREKLNGDKHISMAWLDKICEMLNCDIGDILTWKKGDSDLVKVKWEVVDKCRYSMYEISKKSGIPKASLYKARKNNSLVKRSTLQAIADAIKISEEELKGE